MDDIIEIFARLGFHVADGPEIEWDVYNFEKLCFPADHPARDMQDTFSPRRRRCPRRPRARRSRPTLSCARTPARCRSAPCWRPASRRCGSSPPARCTAGDSDVTHTPMFHQVRMPARRRGVSMAHLRGTLDAFVKAFFGPHIQTRLRPSYFPFTEPSPRWTSRNPLCGGKGCKICKGSGWMRCSAPGW